MSKKFDRSKFKTSNSLAAQEKELESKIGSSNFSKTDIIEFKEDGEYLIRFWPTPVEKSYFMLPDMIHFMKMAQNTYDDDNKIIKDDDGNPVTEVKMGVIKNSTIHGNTPKDVIDEYIAFARKQANEMYPKDKIKRGKYLKHIDGFKPPSGKYIGGIKPQLHYIAYGSILKKQEDGTYVEEKFGRIKVKQSIRTTMLTMAAGGDQASTDPFSDPDDGFIVKVVRDSVAGKKDMSKYYQTSWEQSNYVPIKWPLSDEMLEEKFADMVTLPELYENKYTAKTFDKALDGLQRFDAEHEYNFFSFDSFMDTLEEISGYYPDPDDEDAPIEAPATAAAPEKEEVAPPPDAKKAMEEVEESTGNDSMDEALEEQAAVEEEVPFKKEKDTGNISTADKLAAMRKKIAGTKA
jgi:hypothetical protein